MLSFSSDYVLYGRSQSLGYSQPDSKVILLFSVGSIHLDRIVSCYTLLQYTVYFQYPYIFS